MTVPKSVPPTPAKKAPAPARKYGSIEAILRDNSLSDAAKVAALLKLVVAGERKAVTPPDQAADLELRLAAA